ncbi:double-strand break repair helicase AddA [Paremcibacter congregatus]|uniref:DNA 3'-5' helicase n=1 Tax=Paremcibacter congregatus TaxID=2043170 RepID=A0A2G4YNQ5_9PROT|nr:double-strand break repair helicase AddA [Paremcibacter congregatus]PHZ83954.1 double-strand break repair helicase AddA [Paremcibacter congregatus]QDE25955.1 double-strand break repair helicase AddA [Paremcibacter congregatus]
MTAQTPDQKRASDPTASVWVAASAGTGKTFVLTNRVLRILLNGTRPERILCLTFTKAAAAEMANRLNKRLGQWVTCSDADLRRDITDLTGHAPRPDEQDQARKLFAQVLEVPGGLKIQTIHAFCQSLLGRFPLEAGIAPHFQVMDERTALDHLARARDAVLTEAQAAINPALAEALAYISRKVTETTFGELIRELIGQRSGLEQMLGRVRLVAQAISAMENLLGLSRGDTRESLIAAACEEENFSGAGLRQAVETLLGGSAANQKTAALMAGWLGAPDDRRERFEGYKSAYLTTKGEIRKSLMPKKLAESCPGGLAAMEAEADRLQALDGKLKLVTLLDNSRALLSLGAAMMTAFRDSKKRHAVMDYDDLILKVTDLISREGIADWILYKLDGGIDHILIDEAQDTNPEQWRVVKALAEEFFTGEGQGEAVRTLFAVGDVKQSIYSFQRADPKEFVDNRLTFEEKSAAVDHSFHNVNLALSFRSTAAVLSLVDQVFIAADSRIALSFSPDEIRHLPSRVGHAGLVEVWDTSAPDVLPDPDDWQPPVIQQPSHAPEMKVALRIADRIKLWLDTGEILEAQGRPIRAGDIMILVRRRTAFDDYMIRALKARDIPVAGQDKMLLSEQIAVMDLMAVGQLVLLPDDDLTLAVVLKSPLVGFSEEDLYDLAYGRRGSLWAALLTRKDERDSFRRAHEFLTNLTNFADQAPPFEFYSHLLTSLRGREKLLARLGEEANDPIDEFLQLAMGYEANNISSLQGFLSWVEQGNVEIKRDMEQGQDQVRIMTVHGAKGLQAPIVFLPDTCQVPSKGSRLLWADGLLFWPQKSDYELGPCAEARAAINLNRDQEYLRLLYVALTRAEDRLYITGWDGKRERSENCWYDRIKAALSDMDGVRAGDDSDDYLLRYHCPQEAVLPGEEARTTEMRATQPLPPWAKSLPPAEPSPVRPLSPSRPEEEEPAVQSPLLASAVKARDQSRFHRGRLIHRLLEILPDMAVVRQAQAAEEFLSQPAYDLAAEDIAGITKQIMGILSDPAFAAVFGPGSRAEVPIVGLVGATPVSGQVDRLVVTEDSILVVDYKTNRPPPFDVADVSRLYLRQMAAYRAVLRDIYPDKEITCMLLWTDVADLMALPNPLLDQVIF